jgi:hypothetical protein
MDRDTNATVCETVSACVTVREVMAIYRIGRCTAYEQAALFLRHGPGHGIPCIKLGNSLRFPLAWIEEHIGRATTAGLGASSLDDDTLGLPSLRRDREAPASSAPPASATRRGTT